jgi:cyclic dehypoxanthinyl futalosine synthase
MNKNHLVEKALNRESLSFDEGLYLYTELALNELMETANSIRKKVHSQNKVGWMIDRNVNITNICYSFCKFCNFCRKKGSEEGYVTSIEQYREKISELKALGGDQLLLQGGMHPDLGIEFYEDLFRQLKAEFPEIKLHTLGPPEVFDLAKKANLSIRVTLERLVNAGMDSLPGAGAEILSDRVRKIVSPAKCTTDQWLDVMSVAHQMNLPTSATMMFGHVESVSERIEHLIRLRGVQNEVPKGHYGFINFVPWPFMDEGTRLKVNDHVSNNSTARDYIRMISISRILLNNIDHIQASWLTVGPEIGQIALHSGDNDLGSIMIEENVVSSAGAPFKMDATVIQKCIRDAGFKPYRRNQLFQAILDQEN